VSRKRIAAWTAGIAVGFVVLVLVVGYFVLRSSAFHEYVISKVEQIAGQKLGSPLDIQSFDLHLSNLSLDLNGITVQGSGSSPYGPLLQIDHIGLNVKIISVLHRKWNLNSITVDHPVAHVFIDKAGESNIPSPHSSSSSHTNIFDLAVKHAQLNRGEVYFNDRKATLYADLHDLLFQSFYGASAGGEYIGNVSYKNGSLQFGSYNPLPHDLNARFEATRTELKLSPVTLQLGASQIQLNAELKDYSSPSIQASYRATLVGSEFRRVLNNPEIPTGDIMLSGNVKYVNDANRPALDSVVLNGDISSKELLLTSGTYRGVIRDLAARYSVMNGNAAVQNLHAILFGGTLAANVVVHDLSGKRQSQLDAQLRGISVAEIQSLAAAGFTRDVHLSGATNAAIKARWNGSMQNLIATADAVLQAQVTPHETVPGVGPAPSFPVNAQIHARYFGDTKEVSLTQSYLHLPQTSLNFNGTVSNRSSLQVGMQSNNLHELELIANAFRRSSDGIPPSPLDLYGTASFYGTVRGSTTNPHLQGQFVAANLRLKQSTWRVIRANVVADSSQLSLQNGEADPAQQGRIAFSVQTALHQWSFTTTSEFNVRLSASHISASDLAHAANSSIPAKGTLNANINMHGSELRPVGQGTVVLSNAELSSEPIQALTLSFRGTGNEIRGTLGARLPAGSAVSEFTYYPRQQGYTMLLKVANLQLGKLEHVRERNLKLSGVLNMNASGRGTLKDPGIAFTAQIPNLHFQDQDIRGLTLTANVVHHLATLDLTSEAVNTGIRAHGTIGLTDGYEANLRVDTGTIPLQPLLATYAPQASDATGQAQLHATLRGPLKNRNLIEAHAQIPVLTLKYHAFEIGAVHPILIDYTRGALVVQRSEIRGTDTDLQFQGSIPARASAPSSLLLIGNINLRLLQIFQPDLRSRGQIRFNINSFGQRTNPNLQGQIRIENVGLTFPGAPLGIQAANGVLTLTNKRIDITSFNGQVGGGTVTATGGVVIRPALQFDVAVAGNGITLLYPAGVRSGLDTNLSLTGNMQAALLRGQVRLNRLSFTPDFDLSTFTSQFSNNVSSPPTAGFANNVQLQVAVQTGSGLNLVSRTLSLQGGANLRIQGTAADPVVLGRADITGGDVIFLANRYVIQGGSIAFVNPARTEPVVNIAATTTINQYNISLRVEGPADRLRTTYTSDPSLPPVDIINLLAFGKTTEAQAANANAGGSLGPESVLASGISSQIAGRLQKIAGISQLSIDPVLGPNQGAQGARVTIQQRVTGNLFVTFSTDVTSTQQQIIQVQYNLNRRWSLSADRDQNGGFGFDARVHKNF